MKNLKKDTWELREEARGEVESAKNDKERNEAIKEYNRLDRILYNESTQIDCE